MNYMNMTNEELVSIITESADNGAYDQLFRNLAPIILHEAEMYRGKMVTYSTEDFLQEGNIIAWQIISKGSFKSGRFATYYGAAIRKRLVNIYRDYTLKNLICVGESEDCRGNITKMMVEADYAKAYREKHRAQCKAWYEKKKASQPPKEPKPKKAPETKEERSKRIMAYQKEYYAAHPEKLEERRAKARERERTKRAAKKAERLAQASAN